MKTIIRKALNAKRESKQVEFKQAFKVDSPREWCEIIKDIAAIANSGGGVILIGLDNRGNHVGADVSGVLNLDPAAISDKITSYTGSNFSDFEVQELRKGSKTIAALIIGCSRVPLVFTKPGTYVVEENKQNTAFGRGTVYFRHGAKSEPGNSDDLRQVIESREEEVRRDLSKGLQKVVQAPRGSQVAVFPPEVRQTDSPNAFPIRLVDDPNAPAYRGIDPNQTYPFRQIDVSMELNKRMSNETKVNPYDVQVVRRVYGVDRQKKYYYKPKFASPQYSEAFVRWMLKEYKKNKNFFRETRDRYRKLPIAHKPPSDS